MDYGKYYGASNQNVRKLVRKQEQSFTITYVCCGEIKSVFDVCRKVGKYTYGHIMVYRHDQRVMLEIGSFTSIAAYNVKALLSSGGHFTDYVTTYPLHEFFPFYEDSPPPVQPLNSKGDMIIGSDVWIGIETLLMPGIKIGDGAVIGAGSVVVKDVPPYAVVGGNPARVLKYRFHQDIIDELLKIRWWDWEDERIREAAPFLMSKNVEEFIKLVKVGKL
ncbi:CatB-related O-acetyltransferase [Hydrogenobaculum sp.]